MIGATIGAYAGGDLSDKYAAWHAKKNGGIFEPEFRLVPLVLPLLIVPAGLLMYVPCVFWLMLGTDLVWRISSVGPWDTLDMDLLASVLDLFLPLCVRMVCLTS